MAQSGTNGAAGRARSKALRQAESAAEGGLARLLADLADRVGARAGVSAVFGEPVEREGRTVIPVARSLWGSGAGSGVSEDEGVGSGGGGGAATQPLGYIEITGQGTTYVPLQRPWQDVKLILAWALAIWLVARALSRILRG